LQPGLHGLLLSEHAEAVKDLPLEEVLRRIDMIFDHYGRIRTCRSLEAIRRCAKRDELVAIVRWIRDKGMRPTLFTNGIRAKRDLLRELVDAGLVDVAFHVDMTQQRKDYASERALNALRQEYIERARGLRLSVMFNTTVFDGNFDQIPEVVAFFVRNSDAVRLASFHFRRTPVAVSWVVATHGSRLHRSDARSSWAQAHRCRSILRSPVMRIAIDTR